MHHPDIYLIDNGSLRPSATFGLRRLAAALSVRTGRTIQPVSLLHSHKIDTEELGGEPATILKRQLRQAIGEGKREFLLLPLFLGPSRAISDYIPEVLASVQPEGEELHVVIADPVCGSSVDQPDKRLAEILSDHVLSLSADFSRESFAVAMVDHGTPAPEVNVLRNAVAADLRALLKDHTVGVTAASMERREGPEYAFNEPLLENLNSQLPNMAEKLIVAMFFLLPGRHAGAGGDVVEISQALLSQHAFGDVYTTSLIGEHPKLLEILTDRLEDALPEE
ncbi:MAG: sirohydrochlorin chelatase [Coraliomargaritaceae bacterium]